jgi:uncharacterized protein (DUF983 family)
MLSEAEARAEGRREAAPAALITLLGYVALAGVSWAEGWDLVRLPWWVWLLVALPVLLLTIDLAMSRSLRGLGLVRSREAAWRSLACSCWETSPRWRSSWQVS